MANPIIINNTICFTHVPKTGGSFIINMMEKLYMTERICGSHAGCREIRKHTSLPLFCYVRNPADWLVSMWRYWSEGPGSYYDTKNKYVGENQPRSQFDVMFSPQMVDFIDIHSLENTFIKYITKYTGFIGHMYNFYTSQCEHICKYEQLVTELLNILSRYKLCNKHIKTILIKNKDSRVNESNISIPHLDVDILRDFIESEITTYRKYGYKASIEGR